MKDAYLNLPQNYIHTERCSDGNCCFRNPNIDIGMQTNGGCRCLSGLEIGKRQAIKAALNYLFANTKSEREI